MHIQSIKFILCKFFWIQEKENLYEFMIIIRNFDYNLQIIFGNSDLISIFLFLFKILLIIIL